MSRWSVLLALCACRGSPAHEAPAATTAVPAASTAAPVATRAPASAPLPAAVVQPGAAPASSGPCAQLHALLQSKAAGLRYFAEVTPNQQGAAMQWSAVRSRAEADERSPDGVAGELWTLAERDGWRLASLAASSASGDWLNESELCYRPDGTLAQRTDRFRYSEHGLVDETTLRSYAPDGRVLSNSVDARHVASGERAEPGTSRRPEPSVPVRFAELPFASALVPAP